MGISRLETVETLAERYGLPERTIVREVMRSRLPYVSVAGGWRFRDRDIEVWLERAGPLPRLQLLQGGRGRRTGPLLSGRFSQRRPVAGVDRACPRMATDPKLARLSRR